MLMPAKYNGRPYLWFSPPLLKSVEFANFNTRFQELDAALHKIAFDLNRDEFASAVEAHRSSRMMGGDYRAHEGQERQSIFPAIEQLCAADLLSSRSFIAANGLLTGRLGIVRQEIVWIGGIHPADSTYVAPAPAILPRLLSNLATFLNISELSVTLRASVGLVKLLQIHPFADANGRTSRALFLAICVREFGFRSALLRVLPSVWRIGALRLWAASLRIRDYNDWEEFMELAHTSLSLALTKNAMQVDAR
jgi:hypothetical protein